jgi:hypothetical protein
LKRGYNKIKVRTVEIGLLYFFYLLFLASVFWFLESNVGHGFTALITIILIAASLMDPVKKRHYSTGSRKTEFQESKILFFCCLLVFSICSLILLTSVFGISDFMTSRAYILLFAVKLIFLFLWFNNSEIPLSRFVNFINITYLIYLGFSIIFWLTSTTLRSQINAFFIDLGFFQFQTLFGIEGTTASIDSYSGLILILNLIFKESANRRLMIVLSCTALFLAFRQTPVFALLITLGVMKLNVIRNGKQAALIVLAPMVFICLVLFIIMYNHGYIYLFGNKLDLFELFYHASHARTMLWQEQLNFLFERYNFWDYLLGHFDDSFQVMLYNMDREMIHKTSDNAHNSYFALFYRNPVLTVSLYVSGLVLIARTFHKKTFPVIHFIMLVALSNATIFSLQNPVYIFTLIFLFSLSSRWKHDYAKQ